MPDDTLNAALTLAAQGLHVFPVRPGMKKPALDGWQQAASDDPDRVRAMFISARFDVGIATGARSGVFVLDVDCKNGAPGFQTLAELEREFGALPSTWIAESGSGGRHYYFRYPEGGVGSPVGFAPGLDIRSDHTLIIAPPSMHESGVRYRWLPGKSPNEEEIAPCPGWLLHRIRNVRRADTAKTNAVHGGIAEGSRNATLFRIACSHRANGSDEAELRQILSRENANRCAPPLPEEELKQIASSAMRYDPNEPMSDLGMARRLVAKHGADIRYHHGRKCWRVWTGVCWKEDKDGTVMRWLKALTDDLLRDTSTIVESKARTEARKTIIRTQSKQRLESTLSVAASEPGIPISDADFDQDRMLLNAPNGLIDLRTGELRQHRREDYMTRVCGAVYDPNAECPRFIEFLSFIFGEDEELIAFIQAIIGYALTGETSEQCLFLLHGVGKNGKSVLLAVLRAILGTYALNTPTETFLSKPGGRNASNDLARLDGARFVTAIESDDGRNLAEALIKHVTGGEPITARFLFAEFFEFTPQFKLFFATNHRPSMNGADAALWRRVHLIPFSVVIPPEKQQRKFDQILLEEREGILRWAVQGAVNWHEQGLNVPGCVRNATENYRRELDHVGTFLADMCERAPAFEASASDLHSAYIAWAIDNDRPHLNQQEFGKQLTHRGVESTRRGGKVLRTGVRLRSQKLKLVEAA